MNFFESIGTVLGWREISGTSVFYQIYQRRALANHEDARKNLQNLEYPFHIYQKHDMETW